MCVMLTFHGFSQEGGGSPCLVHQPVKIVSTKEPKPGRDQQEIPYIITGIVVETRPLVSMTPSVYSCPLSGLAGVSTRVLHSVYMMIIAQLVCGKTACVHIHTYTHARTTPPTPCTQRFFFLLTGVFFFSFSFVATRAERWRG